MTDPANPEFRQLWQKYSKEDLWNHVSEWWESAGRARVVMMLAMHHTDELSLNEMVAKVGEPEAFVRSVLADLENQKIVVCRNSEQATFKISDEAALIKFMQQCCQRTSAAAGFMSTLAGWAGTSD